MSFSKCAACNAVPLLARIVLGAAFIGTGYVKFTETEFIGEDAATLRSEGWVTTATAAADTQWTIEYAAFFQDDDQDAGGDDDAAEEAGGQDTGAGDDTGDDAAGSDDAAGGDDAAGDAEGDDAADGETPITTVDTSSVKARGLYHVALMLHRQGIFPEYAPTLAYVVMVVELVGGALLLVGFFSRIWGLGLAITMGMAFYMTSMEPFFASGLFNVVQGKITMANGSVEADGGRLFASSFTQAGLFVLAFGVFLTGPGAFSVDRFLFGRNKGGSEPDIDLT